jgi:hypothetical protein
MKTEEWWLCYRWVTWGCAFSVQSTIFACTIISAKHDDVSAQYFPFKFCLSNT